MWLLTSVPFGNENYTGRVNSGQVISAEPAGSGDSYYIEVTLSDGSTRALNGTWSTAGEAMNAAGAVFALLGEFDPGTLES
jgi:hypothetical protein